MIAPILYGVFSAVGVSLMVAAASASYLGSAALGWLAVVAVILGISQWSHSRVASTPAELELERYDGIPDLLIHLHSPATPDRGSRWAFRGVASWILTSMGAPVGAEGGASELIQSFAMRLRGASNRWSDMIRRSDAAMAISAGISAAFGAPFAGVLIPSELAIGGRLLSSVLAALSAFMASQYLSQMLARQGLAVLGYRERLSSIWGFRLLDWREWLIAAIVVLLASVIGAVGLVGLRQVRQFMERLSGGRAHRMTLLAALLLASIFVLRPQFALPLPTLFEQVIRGEWSPGACLGLTVYLFMSLLVLGAGLGTMGVWWPVFLLGAVASFGMLGLLPSGWVSRGFVPNAAILGAVAVGSIWMRTPISFAVLAFEVTQNGSLLLPCLLAATLARWVDRRMGQTAWVDQLLAAKGFPIEEGRSVAVLRSLRVRDAMVRNFETVHESDSVRVCHERILECHYPFLAVLDSSENFKGLLTVDAIESGLLRQEGHSHEKLAGLLEAKDLLYRAAVPVKTVREESTLAELRGVFEGQSCIAVLEAGTGSRVVGLLFPHDIRQCYDREVARLSFVSQASQISVPAEVRRS